ncbi:2,5-dichloro-2,5-cyclohexadiene-1,4-diol dehydrogenase LinX [subsurface metagenome]
MGRLDSKVAIVTGGGSGMGEATSILFAKEGAKVAVADWVAEGGERVVEKIKAAGGEATFVKVDVSKAAGAEKMIKTAVNTYGKLNILFNNAGIFGPMGIKTADFKEEDADKLIAVNFKGVYLSTKYAIPEIIKSGGGSIISTASECAIHSCSGVAVYSGTKGAVLAFSRVVAMEYVQEGIRANTISPGMTRTPIHADWIGTDRWKAAENNIPLGRACEPEDVAYAALFLASDESKYITAANLMVDAGFTVKGWF